RLRAVHSRRVGAADYVRFSRRCVDLRRAMNLLGVVGQLALTAERDTLNAFAVGDVHAFAPISQQLDARKTAFPFAPRFAVLDDLAQRHVLCVDRADTDRNGCHTTKKSSHGRSPIYFAGDLGAGVSRHSQINDSGRIAPPCLPLWPPSPISNL